MKQFYAELSLTPALFVPRALGDVVPPARERSALT